MQEINFEEALEQLVARDTRYHRDAYHFVREGLDHTQKAITKEGRGRLRHVSGQELLEGIRQYALEQYGPMTMMVLGEWGVHDCKDFGEIVFNMVESGLLAKTEKDTRTDFEDGYDFYEAFQKPYLPDSKVKRTETAPVQPSAS